MRRRLLPPIVYSLAACVFTWPLAPHMRSLLGASDSTGDPALNLWTLGWDLRSITRHPAWLFTGRIFDANIFFPARHTLAFSDHLLPQAIALWPVYAATGDLVLCYNVLLLASLVGAAWAMHLLVRTTVGGEAAAFVAGLVFGFAPYHFTQLVHVQLQSLYWLPLTLLFLHRLRAGGRWLDTVALGLTFGLEVVSSAYYAVIGGVGLLAAAVLLAVVTGPARRRQFIGRSLVAVAIAIATAWPWTVSYRHVADEAGAGRNLFEASHGSAVLASYVQAPPANLVYGRTGWLRPGDGQHLPRKDGPEQALFPGFCALLLALVACARAPRDARAIVTTYAAVGLVGIVLSLGPDGIRPLYRALYGTLIGMQAVRAPARFSVLFLCAIAILAAVGIRVLGERMRRARPIAVTFLVAIIAVEFLNATSFPAPPVLASSAGRWLHARPGTGAVVCVPMDFDVANTPCMLQSLEHDRPIVNGYSGVRPPFFAALVDVVNRIPSVDSLLALHDLGVQYIVSDRPLVADRALADAVVEQARFDTQRVYELVWSPRVEALVSMRTDAPPPEPGPISFLVGESAVYRIQWTTGPLNVPAANATVTVKGAGGDAAFEFSVSGTTAPWVSRFFEADAALSTTASRRLLPLSHAETIVEGGRRIERRFDFDYGAHTVRMSAGGTSIRFPLAANARDPISTLFFLRTLPLDSITRVTLPLTDNGRQARLDVTVAGKEQIAIDGRQWSAWKIEPRLHETVDRRAPPSMTAWISADAQRIPLVFQVDADYGSVRAELTSYRPK